MLKAVVRLGQGSASVDYAYSTLSPSVILRKRSLVLERSEMTAKPELLSILHFIQLDCNRVGE